MPPLPDLAAVAFTGADARDFLHAQLSADIAALAPGESVTACYCNPKGRVLDHVLVHAGPEGVYTVLLVAERVPAFVQRLRMFVLRSAVTIEPLTGVGVFAVDAAPPEAESDNMTMVEGPGGLRYAIGAPGEATDTSAIDRWRFKEIEHGMLWLGEAGSGRHLPQMLGLDTLGSVNFRKGCYPGQEVVARARYLGKVKQLPALAILEGEPRLEVGDPVRLSASSADSAIDADAENGARAEVVAAANSEGRAAVFLTLRGRDDLSPRTLVAGKTAWPVQRWATM